MVNKPHWFKFYPEKWFSGTRYLSPVLKSCYLELLLYQFDHGALPKTKVEMMDVCGITDQGQWDIIWGRLERKFEPNDEGLKINPTMEEERERALKHYEQRANASKKGGKSTQKKHRAERPSRSPSRSPSRASSSSSSLNKRSDIKKTGPGGRPESLESVCLFAKEKRLPLDTDKFWCWGESKGWPKLKNWQMAARNACRPGGWAYKASASEVPF